MAAESCPVSLLMIFFQGKRLHIAEDGHRGAVKGPTRQGVRTRGRPPSSWIGCGPLTLILSPVFFINSKNDYRGVLGLLELCRIGL